MNDDPEAEENDTSQNRGPVGVESSDMIEEFALCVPKTHVIISIHFDSSQEYWIPHLRHEI
jgi:hypothetical protein